MDRADQGMFATFLSNVGKRRRRYGEVLVKMPKIQWEARRGGLFRIGTFLLLLTLAGFEQLAP